MSKLLISFLLVSFLGIISAAELIAAGCDTNKTCISYGSCNTTNAPTGPNIGTIYTKGDNEIQFQLQYDNSNAGWIAMGISDTQSMPNSYIFLCHRSGTSAVNIQQRFATARALPMEVMTLQLSPVSYINSGSILNCTFTAPVEITGSEGSIRLNYPAGYYVLLAWGMYGTDIQQHGNQMTNRCFTTNRIRITTAAGVSTTAATTTPSGASAISPTVQFIFVMLALLFASYIYM